MLAVLHDRHTGAADCNRRGLAEDACFFSQNRSPALRSDGALPVGKVLFLLKS